MGILDPTTCGYGKIITFQVLTDGKKLQPKNGEHVKVLQHRILEQQYNELQSFFGTTFYNVSYTIFRNSFNKIIDHIRGVGKKSVSSKEELINTFNKKSWNKLSKEKKAFHTLYDCQECLKHYLVAIAKFPIKGPKERKRAIENGILKEKILQDATNKVVKDLDRQFSKEYGTPFTKQLTKMKIINNENNKENITNSISRSSVAQELVTDMNKQSLKISVDMWEPFNYYSFMTYILLQEIFAAYQFYGFFFGHFKAF